MHSRERRLAGSAAFPADGDTMPHFAQVLLNEPASDTRGGEAEGQGSVRARFLGGARFLGSWALARTRGVLRVDGGLEERDVVDLEGRDIFGQPHCRQLLRRLPPYRLAQPAARVARQDEVGQSQEQVEALEKGEVLAVAALDKAALAIGKWPRPRRPGHLRELVGWWRTRCRESQTR